MISNMLSHSMLRVATNAAQSRLLSSSASIISLRALPQLRSSAYLVPHHRRCFSTSPMILADAYPNDSKPTLTGPSSGTAADAVIESDPNRNAAFLGEADSDDGFEAYRDAHGDPPASLDASNSSYLGEADSDDGFEIQKDIEGIKQDAVDATNSSYLGEADSDDGFVVHREQYPEEGDHKLTNPEESGLHGQSGEQDR